MVQNVHYGMHSTGFGVVRAVNQPPNPRVHQRACAHSTRLNCSKQLTVAQTMIADAGSSLAQGDHFCVGSGIGGGEVTVEPATDDFSLMDHNRADRDFTGLQSALRRTERFLHPEFVSFRLRAYGLHDEYCSLRQLPDSQSLEDEPIRNQPRLKNSIPSGGSASASEYGRP